MIKLYHLILHSSCLNKSSPTSCAIGTYAAPDQMSCETCPKGSRCPSASMASPIQCVNGTYQNDTGQSTCHDCPGGYSCLNAENTPVPCNAKEYSSVGVAACSACPAGHR